MVDDSDLRRGSATANAVWGNKAPVLVGDFLFSRAFQLMVEDGSLRVLDDPVQRLGGDRRGRGAAADHLQRHRHQRGGLSRGDRGQDRRPCSRPPARSAPSSPSGRRPRRTALAAYGDNLGIAFQLIDDALDYSAREALLGKSVGDDFREGKITLPVLLAFARGGDGERAFWRRTLEELEQRDGDLEQAQELIARARRDRGHRGPRRGLRAARAAEPRTVPLLAREAGDARPARFLHRPRLLSRPPGLRRADRRHYRSGRAIGV